jgi:hypothetical protein
MNTRRSTYDRSSDRIAVESRFRSRAMNGADHSRRLIQTAYVCFQQLNDCEDLSDEQKQWIQTWMDTVSNVMLRKGNQIVIGFLLSRRTPKICTITS